MPSFFKKNVLVKSLAFLGIALVIFFSYRMFLLSLPYTGFKPGIDFLKTKYNVYHLDYWRYGFYTHVFFSIFALLAGATQFIGVLMRKYPRVHRYIGISYMLIVIFISGPGAFVMSLHANGGFPAQVSFVLQTVLWYIFTITAYYYARKKNFVIHGEFMLRSYSLTFAAVTLRLLVLFFTGMRFNGIRPVEIYITVAWLSWVINILLAEALIRAGWIKWIIRSK